MSLSKRDARLLVHVLFDIDHDVMEAMPISTEHDWMVISPFGMGLCVFNDADDLIDYLKQDEVF